MQSDRLHKVLEHISEVHSLCGVLGLDFSQTVSDVHPSLERTSVEQATNISNSTLEGLEHTILTLKTERKTRIQKVSSRRSSLEISCHWSFSTNFSTCFNLQLKDILTSLFELWNLMDSSRDEKSKFSRITSIMRVSETEVTEPGLLSTETIEQVWSILKYDFHADFQTKTLKFHFDVARHRQKWRG